jgi:lambda family phage tail tape measure protein
MTDETAGSTIGTARVDVVVDTSTWETSIKGTKAKISDFSQAAQDAYGRMDAAQKKATDSAIKQAAAFGKTRDQLILMRAEAKGVAGPVLNELASNMAKVAKETAGAGHATEAFTLNNSNSRRELGRLVNDLANGNYGRFQQTALTLANYSGLMGLAFSATGLAVAAGAVAVGAFGLAAYQTYEDQQLLNKELATTGNFAGVSITRLDGLATSLASLNTGTGKTKDILRALAADGEIGSKAFAAVGQAAVDMANLTGDSADKAADAVGNLFDGTVAGALKANDQYHFLNAAVVDHIHALEQAGDKQGALAVEAVAFHDAVGPRTVTLTTQTYGLASAWEKASSNIHSAWENFKNYASVKLGTADLQAQLDAVNDRLNSSQSLVDKVIHPRQDDIDLRDKLQAQIDRYNTNVGRENHATEVDTAGAQGQASLEAIIAAGQTNEQKRKTELIKAHRDADAAITSARLHDDEGMVAKIRASEKAAEAAIYEKYKDPKKSKTDPFGEINGLVQKAQVDDNNFGLGNNQQTEQVTRILAIVDAGAKLIKSGHDVATVQADVAKGVTALNDLYAKQADQLTAKNDAAFKQFTATLDKADGALARDVQNNVLRLSMGEKEYQQQSQINQIVQQGIEAQQKLQAERDGVLAKNGDTSLLDREIAAQQADTDKRVAIVRQGFVDMDAAQADWLNGAVSAMQDFADQGADVAGQTKGLFTDAFSNMTDAVVTFETTGKGSIKSFVTSALTDFARMETRIAASKILQSIIGAFAGSGTSGEFSNSDALAGSSIGGGYSGYGMMANAKGGAYYSPSLSAYSSQIVNKPTTFAFARGAGLMGEAGPEAIMPLQRDSQGRLGVKASNGGGGNVFNFTSNTTVNSDGSAKTQTTGDSRSDLGKQLNDQMTQAAQEVLLKATRPGGLLWRQQQGR